jgi:hypothetical protein
VAAQPTTLPSESDLRTLAYVEAIARKRGILPQLPQSEPMATVTKSIGTTSRDYSTMTAWEADLDAGTIYSASDHAVGECYNDSAFDESVTIDGGATIGLASVTLTVAAGERHDGTAGTGARLVASVFRTFGFPADAVVRHVFYLEFDANKQSSSSNFLSLGSGGNVGSHLIVHGSRHTGNNYAVGFSFENPATPVSVLHNCAVYDIQNTSTGAAIQYGINIISGSRRRNASNCTIHGITNNNGSGSCTGLAFTDSNLYVVQNNVVTDISGTSSGVMACFSPKTPATATVSNNASSDDTASGTGSLTNIVTADQYVSTVVGSEDLRLKSGSDCIDAGTDLSATGIADIDVSITGVTRPQGAAWDIGADEFVSTGSLYLFAAAMG